MDIGQYVEINPKVMMGKPVIKGTRITVEQLLEKLDAGESEAAILQAHPHITINAIRAVLAFASQSLKGESI